MQFKGNWHWKENHTKRERKKEKWEKCDNCKAIKIVERDKEGNKTNQEEGGKKKLRKVAIFTERRGEDEAGSGKDVKTKIKGGGDEITGFKKKSRKYLRQSEGAREIETRMCFVIP
jgi:hypothetical protein